jgi:hypothetical protein
VTPAAVAASSVESAASSAVESAPSVEAAKTGLPSEGIGSRNPAMTETAEGAGMHSSRNVWRVAAVKALMASKASPMGIGGMIKVGSSGIKVIAIDDGPTMRNVGVVVVFDSPVVVPIISPVVPTPAESAK